MSAIIICTFSTLRLTGPFLSLEAALCRSSDRFRGASKWTPVREVGDPKCLSISLILAMPPLPEEESTEDLLRRIPVGVEAFENDAIVVFRLIQ